MSKRLSADQWSQFWHAGTATTFTGRFGENYDGDVAAFWQQHFEACPQHARVVDLAAGNGALAALAVEYAEAHNAQFEVAAVDFADVHPLVGFAPGSRMAKSVAQVDFRIRTRIEDTGLEESSFDLAVSQFGIEYAAPDAAIKEIDRILKQAGSTFAAIVHTEQSAVVAQARDGIRQARLCLKADVAGTAKRMVALLERLRRDGKDPAQVPESEALRRELNNKAGQLEGHKGKFSDPSQIAFYVANCFAPFSNQAKQISYSERLQAVDAATVQTEAYLDRMQDLVDVAAQAKKIGRLSELLNDAGFKHLEQAPFHFEGVLFGHSLVARR